MALRLAALLAIHGLGACTSGDPAKLAVDAPRTTYDAALNGCYDDLIAIDRMVRAAGVRDAEALPVPDYPHLRADRFLGSFRADFATADAQSDLGFAAWVDRLTALADLARRIELANLPDPVVRRLQEALGQPAASRQRIAGHAQDCAARLAAHDLSTATRRAALAAAVKLPDDYADWVRVLGLYPLTAFPVALGFDSWKADNLHTFTVDPRILPFTGEPRLYRPAMPHPGLSAQTVAGIIARAKANPLGIPEPRPDPASLLAAQFAPNWIVDTASTADVPGAIGWSGARPAVSPDTVDVYYQFSHARLGGEVLLQINYLIWFPERPPESSMDLLAGALDAVIWRVTLGTDGVPLIYDTIHACGCYHLFFPVPPLRANVPDYPADITEHALAPADGPIPAPGQRIFIRLAAASHYVQGAHTEFDPPPVWSGYGLTPANSLRSLPLPAGQRRSLFDDDGLVAGTARGERFLLWPMGIQSPGAMRQWGTHATAFVGRRHFDDPWLIADYFNWNGQRLAR